MRTLFVGDSPTVSTGFSRCTRAACDALHAVGHEVHILGINSTGDPHDFPYSIWSPRNTHEKCYDLWGASRLCVLVDKLQPDVIVLLNDSWNVKGYFDELDRYFEKAPQLVPPVVGWIAVDSMNTLAIPLNRLSHVMAWTQFGVDELRKGGYEGSISIVPLGVDHDEFYPRDKLTARRELNLNDSAFIVSVVGRNQHRKKLELSLESFHHWITNYNAPNAEILFHIAPTGELGCNVRALVHYYKLHGKVIISEPHIGKGADNLPSVYAASDVLLSTSQAEGWGLPALEAMACGVPCVLPDFAAFGDRGWTADAALKVPARSHQLTAPMNALAYTIGATSRPENVAVALRQLYSNRSSYRHYQQRGLEHSQQFSWERTGKLIVADLERVVADSQAKRTVLEFSAVSASITP